MNTVVINPGSATLKCSAFAKGTKIAERQISGPYGWKDLQKILQSETFQNHFDAIGLRYVHGGSFLWKPTLVTPSVLKKLKQLDDFAPLHNPIARQLTVHLKKHFPRTPLTLVFDTGFHHDLPAVNATYALPRKITKKFNIRRYGFHGIVCSSIVHQLKERKKLPKRLIICHLGSGCSVTAVLNGKSIDTSMGFTPLEGLIMGTRAGDLDPGIVLNLTQRLGEKRLIQVLNHESGLKALTGTNDMKEIIRSAGKGNAPAELALEIFTQKVAKQIAAMMVSLGGVDLIVFSGGIGEHSSVIRERVIKKISPFGFKLCSQDNDAAKPGTIVTRWSSSAKIMVLSAHEGEVIDQWLRGVDSNH